jgi:hypothetical protein
MSVCCELSGRSLCDGLIAHPGSPTMFVCVSLSVVKCNETLDIYSEYVARGKTRNERWNVLKHLILHLSN